LEGYERGWSGGIEILNTQTAEILNLNVAQFSAICFGHKTCSYAFLVANKNGVPTSKWLPI